jgi:hypothetical protein
MASSGTSTARTSRSAPISSVKVKNGQHAASRWASLMTEPTSESGTRLNSSRFGETRSERSTTRRSTSCHSPSCAQASPNSREQEIGIRTVRSVWLRMTVPNERAHLEWSEGSHGGATIGPCRRHVRTATRSRRQLTAPCALRASAAARRQARSPRSALRPREHSRMQTYGASRNLPPGRNAICSPSTGWDRRPSACFVSTLLQRDSPSGPEIRPHDLLGGPANWGANHRSRQ